MKVTARISDDKVLVEAHESELAHIMGFSYSSELPSPPYGRSRFAVGTEIPIGKLWQIIGHERSRPAELKRTASNLRALADMLESVNEALPTPSVDEPAKAAP